jgi:hypothetical protein
VLEVLVHVDRDTLPLDLEAFAVDVPDAFGAPDAWSRWDRISRPHRAPLRLPDGWRDVAQPVACRALGDAWLATPVSERPPLLRVPTAVLPDWAEPAGAGVESGSWCAVLDPAHPDAARLGVGERHPFAFDRRLGVGR